MLSWPWNGFALCFHIHPFKLEREKGEIRHHCKQRKERKKCRRLQLSGSLCKKYFLLGHIQAQMSKWPRTERPVLLHLCGEKCTKGQRMGQSRRQDLTLTQSLKITFKVNTWLSSLGWDGEGNPCYSFEYLGEGVGSLNIFQWFLVTVYEF